MLPSRHNPHIWVSVSDDKAFIVHDLRCEDIHTVDFSAIGDKNELKGWTIMVKKRIVDYYKQQRECLECGFEKSDPVV